MEDFFISYNKADKAWAEGLANWLDQAMFTTIIQEQDFVPATNFVAGAHKALKCQTDHYCPISRLFVCEVSTCGMDSSLCH